MSLATWKKEFYPKKPTKKMPVKRAIEHSLRKWRGLTNSNLRKHSVENGGYGTLHDLEGKVFYIDYSTCALCIVNKGHCDRCILMKVNNGIECDKCGKASDSPYWSFCESDNPKPMIKLLKKALKTYLE